MHTVADPAGLRQQPQFQTTVEALAQKAHAALPLAHGRIEKAVAIVLSGGVTLHPEGHAVTAGWPSLRKASVVLLSWRRHARHTLSLPEGCADKTGMTARALPGCNEERPHGEATHHWHDYRGV